MLLGTSTVEAEFSLLVNKGTAERNNISKLCLGKEMHFKQCNQVLKL